MMKNDYIKEWETLLDREGDKTLLSNKIITVQIMSTHYETQYFLYAVKLKNLQQELTLPSFNLENLVITTENDDTAVLILKNKDLLDVFFNLSFEIHSSISQELSAQEVINIISDIILKYVYLFKRKSSNKIAKIVGLYGELMFINVALDKGIDNIVSKWFGSDGNRHDFSINNRSIEVKASYLKKGVVTISNSLQLMVDPPEDLFLAYYFLDVKKDNSEDSLQELINEVLSKLSNKDKFELVRKICDLDIMFDENWRLPESYKIELLIEKYYHVTKSFPKLTPENIPDGINKVKYEVVLSSINNECKIDNEELWKHLN